MTEQLGNHNPEENPAGIIEESAPPRPVQIKIQTAAKRPIFTYILIAIMGLLFVGQIGTEMIYGFDVIGSLGVKVNSLIILGQIWRLFTPMFLHGSIEHILFNMYALFQIGRVLEIQYGHTKFLALFFVSGFTGIVASFHFSPYPSLGSSTAVFGLLAAYGIFAWQNQDVFGQRATRTFYNVALMAGINFVLGIMPGSRIDNWGHLGGFVGGAIISWFGGVKYALIGTPPEIRVENIRSNLTFFSICFAVFGVTGIITLLTIIF